MTKKEKYIIYVINDFIDNHVIFGKTKKKCGPFKIFTLNVKFCSFNLGKRLKVYKWFAKDLKNETYTDFDPESNPFDVELNVIFTKYGIVDFDEQKWLWKIICNELHIRLK